MEVLKIPPLPLIETHSLVIGLGNGFIEVFMCCGEVVGVEVVGVEVIGVEVVGAK